MKIRLNALAMLAAVNLVAAAPIATAGPLVFDYTATVTRVWLLNGATDTLGYAAGQKVNGSFSVDVSVPDTDVSTYRAFRPLSVTSFTFGANAADMSFLNYSYFIINADPLQDNVGSYVQTINQQFGEIYSWGIVEGGPTAVLGDDSVDLTKLNVAAFDQSDFTYHRLVTLPSGQLQETQVVTHIDSLRVYDVATPVPEPGTIPLAMTALGVLWATMHRRRATKV